MAGGVGWQEVWGRGGPTHYSPLQPPPLPDCRKYGGGGARPIKASCLPSTL